MKRTAAYALILSALLCACASAEKPRPPVSPHWVFDHWVWEDDENTEAALWSLIDGYTSRGIPVGAVIIDSPWETEYNNFVFNTALYPDPAALIEKLHARGIRAILWMTTMMNAENPGGNGEPTTAGVRDEGSAGGFLVNGGETYKWWKGKGAFVDYTNPRAVEWLHRMMDRALDLGYDGWKVDGIDPMFPPRAKGAAREISVLDFRRMYYSDVYDYTVSKNPEAISLPRSVDILAAVPRGFAPVSHAPASWVGDEEHDWGHNGFLEALKDVLDAGRLGYAVVGSDIGGYHGRDPLEKRLLIRWTQFGAFCPLMENGGHGAHQPWLHDDETLDIYRRYVALHLELKPYLYSMMWKAHLTGEPIVRPRKGKFHYMLGDSLLVAPVHEDVETVAVTLPDGVWRGFFDDDKTYVGDFSFDVPLADYPVFIRDGAIIPLEITGDATGRGTRALAGAITFDVHPGANAESFTLRDYVDRGARPVEVSVLPDGNSLEVSVGAAGRPMYLRVYSPRVPAAVAVNGAAAGAAASLDELAAAKGPVFLHDPADSRLWINPGSFREGTKTLVSY